MSKFNKKLAVKICLNGAAASASLKFKQDYDMARDRWHNTMLAHFTDETGCSRTVTLINPLTINGILSPQMDRGTLIGILDPETGEIVNWILYTGEGMPAEIKYLKEKPNFLMKLTGKPDIFGVMLAHPKK